MTPSYVAHVEAIPLVTGRDPTDLDAGTETVIVRVTDEDGLVASVKADAPARGVRGLVKMAEVRMEPRTVLDRRRAGSVRAGGEPCPGAV